MDSERDIFSSLPAEIVLRIFKHTSNFTTLWNLIRISRTTLAIFEHAALETIEAVLNLSSSDEVNSLMRSLVRIRTDVTVIVSHGEAIRSWQALSFRSRIVYPKPETLPFDQATPSKTLVALVQLSSRIEILASSCLKTMSERCTSRISKPLNLNPKHIPTWCESQRVISTLWRIQYFLDIKLILDGKDLEIRARKNSTLKEFYGLRGRTQEPHTYQFRRKLMRTVILFLSEYEGLDFLNSDNICFPKPKPTDELEMLPVYRGEDRKPLDWPPVGYDIWTFAVSSLPQPDHSLVPYISFDVYGRLGVAVWDRTTMTQFGLFAHEYEKKVPFGSGWNLIGNKMSPCLESWLAILTADEIAAGQSRRSTMNEELKEITDDDERWDLMEGIAQGHCSAAFTALLFD